MVSVEVGSEGDERLNARVDVAGLGEDEDDSLHGGEALCG